MTIFIFFFNDTATTEIYTLSLHDALPIFTRTGLTLGTPQYMAPEQASGERVLDARVDVYALGAVLHEMVAGDRKSTRLNSSHLVISYAVFCLKKKISTRIIPSNNLILTPS